MRGLLPKTFKAIEEAIGEDAAWQMVAAYGGTRVFIPSTIKPDHHLAQHLGMETAARLAEVFGGEPVVVPSCRRIDKAARNLAIVQDWHRGMSTVEIDQKGG